MIAVVILAAGGGTRMKSQVPKVLHRIAGRSMLSLVLETSETINPDKLIVVLGHEKKQVDKVFSKHTFESVLQEEQLGTAHAVSQTTSKLQNIDGDIVILYGDTPLVTNETLNGLINVRKNENCSVSVATTKIDNPFGYGRIIRDSNNELKDIVEEKDANEKEKGITEVNTGIYCFKSEQLLKNLDRVSANNSQNEFYLTDVINILIKENQKISTILIPSQEALGVNSRKDLSKVVKIMRQNILNNLMENGVTIEDPETTYVDKDVCIANDCTILPGTIIKGKTTIKKDCIIGPNTYINDCTIEEGANIVSSHLDGAKIGKNANVGPYSNIRPGTKIGENAKVGAFSEVKKSTIGNNSKVPHLSYIGDCEIGENVNIGAGTITCNYDGEKKFKTIIKDGSFVGSDTMLVAPIELGKNSYTGAGSTLTQNVPDDNLAIERSEQKNMKHKKKKKGE